ncbi:MAG TPA: glycoside hydrolase family 15 protein [Candidatus Micrarchaeaceae archaeon]|nr:glycoside hydrolase family 15 protein [Candidatus Micrarchaeaceae archaeon]
MTLDVRESGYLPIAGYGIIGDCRSVALVGVDGSIDWCCLPRADSPSLFARILDSRRGGCWELSPVGSFTSSQRYAEKTNVLLTIFETENGRAEVTDFMPVDERTIDEHARPHDRPRLIRIVTGLAGKVRFHSRVDVRPDYARQGDPLQALDGRLHGNAAGHHICISGTIPVSGHEQEFDLGPGDTVAFGLTVNEPNGCGTGVGGVEDVRARLRESREFWWTWANRCTYTGPFQHHVIRSALVLKLMTYAPTGALLAASTTSLPELIGGSRNWDYRFTWLRDASFTLYAFFQLGYDHEAESFMQWLVRLALDAKIQNLHTLDGGDSPPELELTHLGGYRDSRPVRIGNAAAGQLQLDVYGEILDCAFIYALRGGQVSSELWAELRHMADLAADRWQESDASIWEVRGENQEFTYSKVMCWVALDRALKIAKRLDLPAETERWEEARRAIHRAVTSRGWSDRLGSFTQAFGSDALDAVALRLAQVGFLEPHDERLKSTIKAVDRNLSIGPLVRRYDVKETNDGVAGSEGTFVMCAFWLADALANVGELEEAERRFERLLSFSSPLGLFSEEIDPRTGMLLGNYPQAFSHLALVAAAVNIERERNHALGQRARG